MSCSSEVLLWKGCTYRNQLPNELGKIEEVLKKLDIPFSSIKEECCGYPLLLAGYLEKMEEQVLETIKLISPFNLIVTACPACLRAFKEIYQDRLHLKIPRILHLVQFLSEKIDEGVLTTEKLKPIDMRVMYHDPCELGRVMNISEDPRRILKLIPNLNLFEQRFTKEASACCGGGGLLPTFSPTLASMAAARKLTQEDELPKDIDAIVTTCPQCILNMRRGLDLWTEDEFLEDVQVLDLAEIVHMSIGEQND